VPGTVCLAIYRRWRLAGSSHLVHGKEWRGLVSSSEVHCIHLIIHRTRHRRFVHSIRVCFGRRHSADTTPDGERYCVVMNGPAVAFRDTPTPGTDTNTLATRRWYFRNGDHLRNRRWGGCVYVLQMFILFFLFFFVFFRFFPSTKYQTTVLGNGWTDFHETLPNDTGENGVCNVVPPPGEWRVLMICVIYAMTLAQSPEGATHGGCVIK